MLLRAEVLVSGGAPLFATVSCARVAAARWGKAWFPFFRVAAGLVVFGLRRTLVAICSWPALAVAIDSDRPMRV